MAKRNTKAQLIEAVIEVTAEQGIENVTVRKISDKLDISEATLYRHFSSRDELLAEAFLIVDGRVSSLLLNDRNAVKAATEDFYGYAYKIWVKSFEYLLEHPSEALFLIRFRYSNHYTNELRARRKAYDGSFNEAFKIIADAVGNPKHSYEGFFINYVFEITLSFAEKIITGRLQDDSYLREGIWNCICGAMKGLLGRKD